MTTPAPPPGFVLDKPQSQTRSLNNLPAPPPGFVVDATPYESSIGKKATQAAAGLNEAIGETVGRAADYVGEVTRGGGPSAIEALQMPDGSYGVPDREGLPQGIEAGFESFNEGVSGPVTTGERIARRTGQEIGRTVPYAAIPYATAPMAALGPAGRPTGGAVAEALKSYNRGVANAPGRAAVGEALATTGAGAGAGVAQEAAPGNMGAEVAGQLVGGATAPALAYAPMSLGAKAVGAGVRHFSPEVAAARGRRAVSNAIGGELTPEAHAGITQAERLRSQVPGFNPSLAEATGAPPIVATQRAMEGSARGAERAGYDARRAGNIKAIEDFSRNRAPAGEGDPEFVIDGVRNRVDRIKGKLADEQRLNAGQRQGQAARLEGPASRAAAGADLRTTMEGMRTATSRAMADLADEALGPHYSTPLDITALRESLLQRFMQSGPFDDPKRVPDVLTDLANYGRNGGLESAPKGHWLHRVAGADPNAAPLAGNSLPSVSFKDLKTLRERVGDELRDELGSALPKRGKIRTLTQLRGALDDGMEDLLQKQSPELMETWRAFRETYKREYIDRFEQGATFKTRQKDGRAYYRTPDEEVGKAFFHAGGDREAQQFLRTFGDDPNAQAALKAYALDDLHTAAVRDGVIHPQRFEAWVRRHNSALERLPFIRDAVSDVGGADAALRQRQAVLTGRERHIGDLQLVRQLERVSDGRMAPDAVITDALRKPKAMAKLWAASARDPDARNALRRAVWDRVSIGSADDVQKALDDFGPSLRAVLGGRHIDDLRTIQAARSMTETVPPVGARAFSPNGMQAAEDFVGMGAPQMASRLFAVRSGRTSARYMAAEMFGRFFRAQGQRAQQALFREALYDPAVARSLADSVEIGRMRPEHAKRLGARLFNLGYESRQDDDE